MKYFGTDGVRGKVGEVLTDEIAYRIGRFIGQYPAGRKSKILISQDTRESGDFLKKALIRGITSSGGQYVDLGISTTPSLSYLVHQNGFDYAIMISASHNPYYDNGIKIFDKKGKKLAAKIENLIEEYIKSEQDYLPIRKENNHLLDHQKDDLINDYLNFLTSKVNHDLSSLNILVDCANGSASFLAPRLFNDLGVKADYIFHTPNGVNINKECGSTYLENLSNYSKNKQYDLCLAFDGDADRVLFMKDGQEINGDHMLYLLGKHLRAKQKLNEDTIVITQMANFGLKKAFHHNNFKYLEVDVGDKYVQAALEKHHLSLGGEQSGHIIFYDYLNTGDGLLTSLKVLDTYVAYGNSFKELLNDLKIYPQTLVNMKVKNKKEILEDDEFISLYKKEQRRLGSSGRILIRPSGTEPLIRIMVEAPTKKECEHYSAIFENYILNKY
ncbi:MAG: phosphoglucosamine mutase [Bacilli bacterium]|jgi:phosphoglucosamine mutase|nr:phosphoglucosamine mutase [Erysipelotrichia bacterium]